MKTLLTSYFIMTLFAFSISLNAQIVTQSVTPEELKKIQKSSDNLLSSLSIFQLPNLEETVNSYIKEDESRARDGHPYRFGVNVPISINTTNSGKWFSVADGRIWLLKIESQDALSLNLIFQNLKLNNQSELLIHNGKNIVMGPILPTHLSDNENSKFYSDVIPGNTLILELYEPYASTGKNIVNISNIIHGYRGFEKRASSKNSIETKKSATEDDCFINVKCPEGKDWEAQISSVALTLLPSGNEGCSGSLINNTSNELIPNFLTAFHCIDSNNDGELSNPEKANSENWSFIFHYESPTCEGSTYTKRVKYQGAQFLAGWVKTDFVLLEMNILPKNAHLSGWDRSSVAAKSGVGIHHPAGMAKKISITDYGLITNKDEQFFSGGQLSDPFTLWRANFNLGYLALGSSGSPFFNQNGRIVGALKGGGGGDCKNSYKIGFYGRLDLSWDGGGDHKTRLRDYLDPGNLRSNTTNTISTDAYSSLISGPDEICNGNATYTYILKNESNNSITWQVSSNLKIVSSNNKSITIKFTTKVNEVAFIKAITTRSRVIAKNIWINRPNIWVKLESNGDGVSNWAKGYLKSGKSSSLGDQKITNIRWEKISSTQGANMYASSDNYTIRGQGPGNNWKIEARVHVTNGCGTAVYNFTLTPPPCESSGYKKYDIERIGEYLYTSRAELCPDGKDFKKDPNSLPVYENTINVYDYTGHIVLKTKGEQVDISGLQSGFYIIKAQINDVIVTKKIIKQ